MTPSGAWRPNIEDDPYATLRGADYPGDEADILVTLSGTKGPTDIAATH